MTIDITAVNDPPVVAMEVPDQFATISAAFEYVVPAATFSDAENDTLTWTAAPADGTALPSWLMFDADTRTLSGMPEDTDAGTLTVKVTADDGNGGMASDEFDITVRDAACTAISLSVLPLPVTPDYEEREYWDKPRFDALPDAAVHGPGTTLTFTFTFDSPVTVTLSRNEDRPALALDVYGRTRLASYTGPVGTPTRSMVFEWTVQRGHYDPDGIEVRGIDLNGATVLDGQGCATPPDHFPAEHFRVHRVRGGYFTVSLDDSNMEDAAREGAPYTIRATRDGDDAARTVAAVDVADSATGEMRSVLVEFHPKGSELSDGRIADGRSGSFTVTPPPDGKADPDGERMMTIRLRDTASSSAWYDAAGTREVTVRVEDNELSEDAPVLAVGPADVHEPGTGTVPLRFRVCLWIADKLCPDAGRNDAFENYRGVSHRVTVDYRTRDGTAQAGRDYRARSGTLTFEPGETVKTVEVTVFADSHDEGTETVWLEVSNPVGSTIGRWRNFGQIHNDGPVPAAWLARFGRTVAEQAIEAVEARFDAWREAGFAGRLAGQALGGGATGEALAHEEEEDDAGQSLGSVTDWLKGETDEVGPGGYTVTGRDLLTGSSFLLTQGAAETGFASFWGRGGEATFNGRDGALDIDGEMSSAMLGADWSRDALVAGLMLWHLRGEGGYRGGPGGGTVESTLSALFPYARYALSERLSVWGMTGYGEGTLTLTPEGGAPLRPDLDFAMGALGGRSVLVGGGGGATLAATSDAFAVRTGTDAVSGPGGRLEGVDAHVTRVRLALEGSHPITLGETVVLIPSLELGVRHDGGDAETGFGADIGAGLALFDSSRGLSAELRARGLLTHEDDRLSERGLSGTFAFDPAPGSDRGLSLSLTQTVGAQASGGAYALLERTTLAGLGNGDGSLASRRLDAQLGYGFALFDDRYTATPEIGLGLSDADRVYRTGWRLAEQVSSGLAFELGLEGTRREFTGTEAGVEHGLVAGAGWRLVSRGAESFELRIEGTLREAAGDDASTEAGVGLRLSLSW